MTDLRPLDLKRGAVAAAWKAWDEAPGNDHIAKTMVEACVAYGPSVGLTYPMLRRRLSAARRAGKHYIEALMELEPN